MRLRRRPWFTLLACLGAAGAVSAQVGAPAEVPDASEPKGSSGPLLATGPAPASPWLNWRSAPIGLSGSVAYDFRASRAEGESSALGQLVTTTLGANSYVYEPWFATVSGTLGLTAGRSRGGGEIALADSSLPVDRNGSAERFLTGNARLDLFPRSRFPFEMHFDRSDSRTDNSLGPTLQFGTQNFGFSQRYRPATGDYALSASVDRREQFGAGFRDTQDQLSGDITTRWKHNEVALGLSQSMARREASDERTLFRTMVGRHFYAPSGAMSVNTTVNWSRTDERLVGYASDLSVFQWSTVGLWRPDATKLALSGSVRGLLMRDEIAGRALDSVGASLGATYEINRNARLSAGGSATGTHSDGKGALVFSGSAGAGWQADTIDLPGRMRYDWYANANANASAGGSRGDSESQTTLNTQVGHSLSRSWSVARHSTLVLNGGQSVTAAYNRTGDPGPDDLGPLSRVLLHSAAATWNTGGDNTTAYARVAYNDARELGGGNARFQLWNFQVSGTWEFNRNSSLSGDLTMQRVSQRSGDAMQAGVRALGGRDESHSASGEVVYRHMRAFDVPRLRFTSRLKLAQDVLKQAGTLATIPDRETRLWENRLDWAIGRLETQLLFRISEVDRKRREFLMLRVQRSFGG